MTIGWKYLDTQNAVIAAIKDWDNMLQVLADTEDEIAILRDGMGSLGGQKMDGMPHSHNPQAFEDTMVHKLTKIEELERKQKEATAFLNWFVPAWDNLIVADRTVLKVIFLEEHNCGEAVRFLAQELSCTENAIYKRKRRALDGLARNLYPDSF